MKVELVTCSMSPQCLSTKMFLDLNGVEYEETVVPHEEMGFDSTDMPILLIDGEIEMSGFDATKLNELFNTK